MAVETLYDILIQIFLVIVLKIINDELFDGLHWHCGNAGALESTFKREFVSVFEEHQGY